jgi:hypothetical protein
VEFKVGGVIFDWLKLLLEMQLEPFAFIELYKQQFNITKMNFQGK